MLSNTATFARHPARMAALLVLALVALILIARDSQSATLAGFEIDANDCFSTGATPPSDCETHGLYSGKTINRVGDQGVTGDDWAQGSSGQGVFEPSASAPHTAATDCYGSNVDINPAIGGIPTFICDGSSDSRFRTIEDEKNIVSPTGKTNNTVWHVTDGNDPGKNDFSHAYFLSRRDDSVCDDDDGNGNGRTGVELDNNAFFVLAGHRGDNEGTAFWGYEFNHIPPLAVDPDDNSIVLGEGVDFLNDPSGPTFDLLWQRFVRNSAGARIDSNGDGVIDNDDVEPGRSGDGPTGGLDGNLATTGDQPSTGGIEPDDLLISFTLARGANQVVLEVFVFNRFAPPTTEAPNGAFLEMTSDVCPDNLSTVLGGDSLLETNTELPDGGDNGPSADENPIEAPTWNVPACDPTPSNDFVTGDGGGSTCRLAKGTAAGSTPTNCSQQNPNSCHLIGTIDFGEATVDLGAFGVTEICFSSMIFTSRSSQVLTGADLKDVGGGGVQICGTKAGAKFHDVNADGNRDEGEPGLGGWTINLYKDLNGNGILDSADDNDPGLSGIQPFASTTTDSNGEYSFNELFPGNYIVCEVIAGQADYIQSAPNSSTTFQSGESLADCSEGSPGTNLGDKGYAFELGVAGANLDNDFGNFKPITKSGVKFHDLNADGSRDADGVNNTAGDSDDEVGLPNWQIHLFGTDGLGNAVHQHFSTCTLVQTQDSSNVCFGKEVGFYTFKVNPPNATGYTVCETLQTGWIQSFPTSGADCSGHTHGGTITPGPKGYLINLTSGQTDTNNDFGNFQNATKSGVKFEDLEADGDKDAGDPGLGGVQIHLFGTDGAGASVHQHFITCDAADITGNDGTGDTNNNDAVCNGQVHGYYKFVVKPGSYTVCESVPTGYQQTFPTAGTGIVSCAGHSGAGGLGYSITLTSGASDTNNHFGNARGSLLIEKRAKSAATEGCTAATSPTPDPANCPVFGGASFSVTYTVGGASFATVTDDEDNVHTGSETDKDPRPGFICLDGVPLNTSFTVAETASNDANYAKDDSTPTTQAAIGPCSGRASATTGDVSFFNTPLSEIEVIFRSLAGTGVTKAQIVCSGPDGVEGADDLTLPSPTPSNNDLGENGLDDDDPAVFDDTDEVFTGLEPGAYDCDIVVDP